MKGDFSRIRFKRDRHYTHVLEQQGRVGLDSDTNEASAILRHLRTTTNRDVIGACGIPKHGGGFGLSWDDTVNDLLITPGRIYVDGILCELEPGDGPGDTVPFTDQPDYPGAELTPVSGQTDLVYLDVWRRHVTAVEDPDLREEALGGPDTTTRLRTVCQVKVLANVQAKSCSDTIQSWDDEVAPTSARLTATVVPGAADEPCLVAPGGGYKGLENHLYRVEVHDPDTAQNGATFKWSRDNGSILVSAEFVDATHVRVARLGWDDVLALRKNDWVEVLDDDTELRGEPGTLAQIVDIGADQLVELSKSLPSTYDTSTPLRVRRWDQASDAVAIGTDLPLEDGIEVTFAGTGFRTGDYWMFAARVGNDDSPGSLLDPPTDAPPDGIRHHYCKLALVTWGPDANGQLVATDIAPCAPHFPPLTELPSGSAGCCSVTVGDGVASVGDYGSIQDAVDALPDGGRICVLPGDYALGQSVTIATDDIVVVGCGRRARILAATGEPAITAAECDRLRLEGLYIQASSPDGAIRVNTCGNVEIHACAIENEGEMDAATGAVSGFTGAGIVVIAGAGIAIRDNAIRAAPCVSVQGEDIDIAANRLRGGGLWVRSGSRRIDVNENEIEGGQNGVGPGIALGGLIAGEGLPSDWWGVSDVRIVHNRISGMPGSGVTSVADPQTEEEGGAGDVDGLVVSGNRITGCALDDPDPFYEQDAVGGVVLRGASHVLIHGNQILENGVDRAGPSCGIFIYDCEGLEVTDNQVVGNGSPDPGQESEAFQAGIAAIFVTEGPYPIGTAWTDSGTMGPASSITGLPAAGIRDNVVVCPRGHAVVVLALGPVAITGNALTSLGPMTQPGLSATAIGSCVFVWNAGVATGLPAGAPIGSSTGVNTSGAAAAATGVPDGRTLVSDNLVTMRAAALDGVGLTAVDVAVTVIAAVALVSDDDIGITGNAVQCNVDGRVLYDVLAIGRTVRLSQNRLSEPPGTAVVSYLGFGGWHVATANQGTHCILPLGSQVIDKDNQVLVNPAFCSQLKDLMTGGG